MLHHSVTKTILEGQKLGRAPKPDPAAAGLLLRQTDGTLFQLTQAQLSKGTLILGGSGSGKSTLLKTLLPQIRLGPEDLMVVFDPKLEFRPLLPGDSLLISADPRLAEETSHWNIFDEIICAGNEKEQVLRARELSYGLCKEEIEGSRQPFFGHAACDILTAILLTLIRRTAQLMALNNRLLVHFVHTSSIERLRTVLLHGEFTYLESYLGPCGSPVTTTQQSILATLHTIVNNVFVGPFALSGRSVSMARLARERSGRTLVLHYDLAHQKALRPVLSLLLTELLQQVLAQGEQKGNTWLILDEFALLPYVENLDQVGNYGRSRGVKLLCGLQSISQLQQNYGEKANAIAAGFSNLLAMRCVDAESRQYVSQRFGQTFETYSFAGQSVSQAGFLVTEADQRELAVGQAYVDLPETQPFLLRFQPGAGKIDPSSGDDPAV